MKMQDPTVLKLLLSVFVWIRLRFNRTLLYLNSFELVINKNTEDV